MGTYLSTPVTDKHTETGCDLENDPDLPVNWAVVDMQGWRKSMEDAHVARTDVKLPRGFKNHLNGGDGGGVGDGEISSGSGDGEGGENNSGENKNPATGGNAGSGKAKVFAVFDGHGGPEVARFCQMHLVDVLTAQKGWKDTKLNQSSSSSSSIDNDGDNADDGQSDEAVRAANVAQALIDSFHALDKLIDDPNRKEEIDRWRLERPPIYVPRPINESTEEDSDDDNDDAIVNKSENAEGDVTVEGQTTNKGGDSNEGGGNVEGASTNDDAETIEKAENPTPDANNNANEAQQKMQQLHLIGDETGDDDSEASSDSSGGAGNDGGKDDNVLGQGLEMEVASPEGGKNEPETKDSPTTDNENNDGRNDTAKKTPEGEEDEDGDIFQDSLETDEDVGEGIIHDDSDDEKEEGGNGASTNDDDDGEVDGEVDASPGKDEEKESGTKVISANDAFSLFTKLLHMNGSPGEEDSSDDDEDMVDAFSANAQESNTQGGNESDNEEDSNLNSGQWNRNHAENNGSDVVIPTKEQLLNPPTRIVAPSASIPTKIQNGRKVCNLPDHPVHAGCTSVVAVIVGRTLVVANAGDSRAVICRAGGLTEPLSFDHKPLQKREMNRITNAGGFVNQFGRVNGNLNLSRSIGDLKYKQVPGIPPSEQMITAEPDIISTSLMPGDEFIILGCDGIWDCLSNEECVKYVRDRIDTQTPRQIGMQMLDDIISADPRASQGIGGDNMTIMIIDLLPKTRPYNSGS